MAARNDGIDFSQFDAIVVSLAPGRPGRCFAPTEEWDNGYLLFDRERLVYLGDGCRFQIPRDELHYKDEIHAFVAWRRLDAILMSVGKEEFRIWPGLTNRGREFRRNLDMLRKRLLTWREGNEPVLDLPNGFALPMPAFAGAGGSLFREIKIPTVIISLWLLESIIGGALALMLGVSFTGLAYVSGVSAVLAVVRLLPLIMFQRRNAARDVDVEQEMSHTLGEPRASSEPTKTPVADAAGSPLPHEN